MKKMVTGTVSGGTCRGVAIAAAILLAAGAGARTFDVTAYGAKADGGGNEGSELIDTVKLIQ